MEEIYFDEPGVISLWVGQVWVALGSNFLRDLYGVDDYDPDNQECILRDSSTTVSELVLKLSYSDSFRDAAIESALQLGIVSARWIMAQYDFAYDPTRVGLAALPTEPVFIGRFKWHE
jgi:hypothetical protein